MLYYIALAVAVGGVAMFLLSDAQLRWKLIAVGLLGASLAMQFVPAIAGRVPWLLPMLLQIVIALWMLFYFRAGGTLGGRSETLATAPRHTAQVATARRATPAAEPGTTSRNWIMPVMAVGVVAAIGGVIWQARQDHRAREVCRSLGEQVCQQMVECHAFLTAREQERWTTDHCQRLAQDQTWCTRLLVTTDQAKVETCYAWIADATCKEWCLSDEPSPCDALLNGEDDGGGIHCDYPWQRHAGL
ncbi:MAG: hypothetical protein KC620_05435 [Myxococcales bacterium]|nr:hypothetical protein [Myxococcales bacterium]